MIWEEPALIADANLQFFLNSTSVMLNAKTDDMEGIIAPTDSRFRMDVRLFEEGKVEEAD